MEFTHYTEYAVNYIRTRLRSPSKYKSFMRASLNPHPTHFVHKYLDLYIGEDGFAKTELSGKTAYFIMHRGFFEASFDLKYLKEKYKGVKPRKFTFIPSSLTDNPLMLETNPDYADDLLMNDPANAAMLLDGNWKYSPAANGFLDREIILNNVVDKAPAGCALYRAWDKAASKPASEGGDSKQRDPDYTCSILFAKDTQNNVYVMGNYVRDKEGKQIARFREKPGLRDQMIEEQATFDGDHVFQVLPRDLGQAGLSEFQEASKKLQQAGFIVKEDKTVANQSKAKRFESFVSACHHGNVYWVKSSFDPAVWDYLLLELENFDGMKNNGYHDDLVDCCSSGYTTCMKSRSFTNLSIPKVNATTMFAQRLLN